MYPHNEIKLSEAISDRLDDVDRLESMVSSSQRESESWMEIELCLRLVVSLHNFSFIFR